MSAVLPCVLNQRRQQLAAITVLLGLIRRTPRVAATLYVAPTGVGVVAGIARRPLFGAVLGGIALGNTGSAVSRVAWALIAWAGLQALSDGAQIAAVPGAGSDSLAVA